MNRNTLVVNFFDEYRTNYCNFEYTTVIVHGANNSPYIGADYQKTVTTVSPSQFSQIIITPKILTTDDDLRNLDVTT